MHPHHCNSSANVLKRASSCQRRNALLRTAGKTIFLLPIMSLHGEEGNPLHHAPGFSRQCFSDVLHLDRVMTYTPFGPKVSWSSSHHPSYPVMLISTPKTLLSAVPEQLFCGAECWAWSGNWAQLKITQQRSAASKTLVHALPSSGQTPLAIVLHPFWRLKNRLRIVKTDTQETLLREDTEIPHYGVSQSISAQEEFIKPPGLHIEAQTPTQLPLRLCSLFQRFAMKSCAGQCDTWWSAVSKYTAAKVTTHGTLSISIIRGFKNLFDKYLSGAV